jgi:hypothetical protein
VLAFLLPASALIGLNVRGGTQFGDQQIYHLATVDEFVCQWPWFYFRTYPAAMTPGYHLLMAGLAKAGAGTAALQAATAVLTAGLVGTLAWAVSRRVRPLDAVLLCLPFAWSQYVLTSGVYVVPHNLAWWGVLCVLLLALRPRMNGWVYPAFGAALLGLLMVRQIHVWAVAPMAAAALWGDDGPAGAIDGGRRPAAGWGGRAARLGLVAVAAVPAAAVLGWFVRLWGGLTPETEAWVRPVDGVNGSAVAMMLATVGFLGVAYAGRVLAAGGVAACRWGAAGAAVAAVAAAIPRTSYDVSAGRWSGLWNLARATPSVADRSPAVVALAAAGGFVIGALLVAQRPRDRWVTAAALAGFLAAHATVNQAWQRYYEPMVLITLAVGCARLPPGRGAARWPLVALAVVQAGLTALSLR